jgi:hypothetical protein
MQASENFSRPHTGPSQIKKPSEEQHSFGSSDQLTKVNANNFNFAPRTQLPQSEHSDFERATDAEQSSYYSEQKANSDSESEEGFYMPTLIHKAKGPAKKKSKKKRKMDSARGISPVPLVAQTTKKA